MQNAETAKGWILEAICMEISKNFTGKFEFYYHTASLPLAHKYFFSHYFLLKSCLLQNPRLWSSKKYVWFTHPKEELSVSDRELSYLLNMADKVFCTCTRFEKMLVDLGVDKKRLATVLGAADPDFFKFHERNSNCVGLSSAYYERKSPDKILELIKHLPHRKFLLLGKGWENYEKFQEMVSQKNFIYIETDYVNYPNYYNQMDVFLSASTMEGGPIPLVEAMMSNVVPVVSDTGFARDIINNTENGYIFPVSAGTAEIAALIEKAFKLKTNIRKSVANLTWDSFSREIINHMIQE